MNFTCFLIMYTLFLSNDLYANISAEYRNNGVIIQLLQAQTCFSYQLSVSDVNFRPGEGNALDSICLILPMMLYQVDLACKTGVVSVFLSFYAYIFGRDHCYHIGIRNDWNSIAYK